MGSVNRRAREKENLRRAILDAARELFVTEDYKAVSMRRIAEKIEYSPTAIYLHFKDKEEILFSLCEEGFALLSERMESLSAPDAAERLRQAGKCYIDFALTQSHYYKIMFQLGDRALFDVYRAHKTMGHRCFGFILQCVADGIAQGRFAPSAPEPILAHVVWASMHGAASLALAGRLGMLPEEYHAAFYTSMNETILRGLMTEAHS